MTHRRTLLRAVGLGGSALALSGCSATGALNAFLPSGSDRFEPDIVYGPGARRRLDLHRPTRAAPPGGHPVALFFYGGSWNSGSRNDYRFLGEALASRGVLAAVADYRLYPEVRYPDFLDDCAQALAATLQQAAAWGGDPKRVFVMGHSAGAYNAAMLALDPRWLSRQGHRPAELAGWIGLAGPYDFVPIQNPDVRPVFHHPDTPRDSQPIAYADRAAIRTFLGAAPADSLVDPQRNTAQLARRLQAAGTDVTLRWYEHANHMTLAGAFARPLRWLAPVLDDVQAFIRHDAVIDLRAAGSPPA